MKKVAIILPAYNEGRVIAKTITEVLEEQQRTPGWKYEVVVAVDQRSNDGTIEEVKKIAQRNSQVHLLLVGPGLGTAFIEGHLYAIASLNPDLLLQTDADGQVELSILSQLVKTFEDGFDLVIGSRFVVGGKNMLAFSRRLFSNCMSWFCRLVMGPPNIREFANSTKAFTPALFQKVSLDQLPWREQTFIINPALLNELVLAGAKYKEVPLVFKNRAEGYSKNKVVNYTYDVITYCLDARLKKWGINIPLFYITRRAKTIIKFLLVGVTGTLVDFIFYNILIAQLGIRPATSKGISTEIAILNNFVWNDLWTFRYRRTRTNLWQKLITFNAVSLGGLAIGVVIVKFLHMLYGDGLVSWWGLKIQFYNLYFFASIPAVTTYNFLINHYVTWKHREG